MPSTAARNPIYLLFPGEVSHSSVTCSNPVMQWVVNACVCVCLFVSWIWSHYGMYGAVAG